VKETDDNDNGSEHGVKLYTRGGWGKAVIFVIVMQVMRELINSLLLLWCRIDHK